MHQLPALDPLAEEIPYLCQVVAKSSWLPHPETVRKVGRAVFPTVRARNGKPRFAEATEGGQRVMYDDNTSPQWALRWTHGMPSGSASGWTFAHVWNAADDVEAYTHPANLVLVPECFASLTDKRGPLTAYLQWHAWTVYGWKPSEKLEPEMPQGYNEIRWRYLKGCPDPVGFVAARMEKLQNERIRIIRRIMEGSGVGSGETGSAKDGGDAAGALAQESVVSRGASAG